MSKNTVKAIALTSKDSATVGAAYAAINAGGLTEPCFLLRITNASNTGVTVSYDGATDNEFILANTTLEVNAQSNAQPNNFVAVSPKGMVVSVKGTAGVGNLYVSGYYQPV